MARINHATVQRAELPEVPSGLPDAMATQEAVMPSRRSCRRMLRMPDTNSRKRTRHEVPNDSEI